MKNTLIVIAVIAVIGIGAYALGQGSNSSTQSVSDTTSQNSLPQQQVVTQAPKVDLNLKSKCATDGKNFIQNYEQSNNTANAGGHRPVWGNPEYHYNTKLNTCLAFITYSQEISEYTTGSMTSTDFSMTIYSTLYAFIFDVYSNQVMLQGVMDRTTPWKGDNIDTLSKYSLYPNIPNLNVSDFNKQSAILLAE